MVTTSTTSTELTNMGYRVDTKSATMRAIGTYEANVNGAYRYNVEVFKILPTGEETRIGQVQIDNSIYNGTVYTYTMPQEYRAEAMALTDEGLKKAIAKQSAAVTAGGVV